VEELADTISTLNKLNVKAYMIDLRNEQDKQAIVEFLKTKGNKLNENTVMTNSFILGNKFNDVWFQELNLT